jgi:hypothetical protein
MNHNSRISTSQTRGFSEQSKQIGEMGKLSIHNSLNNHPHQSLHGKVWKRANTNRTISYIPTNLKPFGRSTK